MARTPEQNENLVSRLEKMLDDYDATKEGKKDVDKIPVKTEPKKDDKGKEEKGGFFAWLFGE